MAAAAQVGAAATAAEAEEGLGETRKLFVGGIPASVQEAELRAHFARFGGVRSVIVMRDRETGNGRGFGFVEFEDEDAAARALGDEDRPRHFICGRVVDVKRARTKPPRNQDNQLPAGNGPATDDSSNNVSYDSKKVFIGGLRDNITEEEFRAYFEKFGTVTDVVVIYDSLTSRPRGFGFVTFASEEAVGKVMRQSFHLLNGTKVEAKIAIPKDEQYYHNGRGRGARSFGGRAPVGQEGSTYHLYNARHGGLYNGYMQQPFLPQPYYPTPYFPMGGYPYGNGYPSQGVTNVPGMMSRQIPQVYGTYPQIYPGFNFVYRGGYEGAATFQNGINGGSDNRNDQTTVDMQDVVNTASITTKLEHMKLGSQ